MKICLISNLYPPFIIGGAEVVIEKIATELVKRKHEVVVISTNPNSEKQIEEKDGVKIYRISPLNFYNLYNYQDHNEITRLLWHGADLWNPDAYFTIKNILKNEKPDIVHIHHFKGLSSSIFSAVKNLDLPLVFTAHDCSLICPRTALLHANGDVCTEKKTLCSIYSKFQKYSIKDKVDWFVAPSQFLIDTLRLDGFFTNVKTSKIPLGVELHNERINKEYDTIDILFAGSLSKHKGVPILIEAFKRLNNENIRLHILGKGKDESEFKKMAESDKRIIFHGFVNGEKLENFYKNANISILPSICYDNSPMMIYESLVNSTPVIGSKIGGIPELIKDNYNGFLFNSENIDELENILKKLVENQSLLKELEKNAFQSAKKYSIEKHIQELEKIYIELIK
ncbi:MAG: glycosyltransferase family 4 protein [Methanobacterium sp.]